MCLGPDRVLPTSSPLVSFGPICVEISKNTVQARPHSSNPCALRPVLPSCLTAHFTQLRRDLSCQVELYSVMLLVLLSNTHSALTTPPPPTLRSCQPVLFPYQCQGVLFSCYTMLCLGPSAIFILYSKWFSQTL